MNSADPVLALVRPEILALAPYSSARKESKGGRIWLDANENPETPSAHQPLLNRYPDPQPPALIEKLAALYGVSPAQVLVTRGSDEGIDLLLRTFCRAGQDAIITTPPTYGMYTVAAGIQNARVVSVPLILEKNFSLDTDAVIAAGLAAPKPADAGEGRVKLVFLCSPNNPTGQLLDRASVLRIVKTLATRAVVVVDEAYVEFASQPSLATEIAAHPNLVVLRTLSKAYGLAGARVGTTLASPSVIAILQKVIAPYPVPVPVLNAAITALSIEGLAAAGESVRQLTSERQLLLAALPLFSAVKRVWPSDANYILIQVDNSTRVMTAGRAQGVIWRDRSKDVPNTIRITVGSADENNVTQEILSRV